MNAVPVQAAELAGEAAVVVGSQFEAHRQASEAIEQLLDFVDNEAGTELQAAFYAAHGLPLDLRKRAVWDELIG